MAFRLRILSTDLVLPIPPGMHGVGREDDNFIVLDDGSVSRHHARLIVGEGKVIVDDLGSSNGTALHGALVKLPQLLEVNETVYFGNVAMRLEPDESGVSPTPPPAKADGSELQPDPSTLKRMRKPTDLIRLEQLSISPMPTEGKDPAPLPEPREAQPPLSESGSLRKGTQSVRGAADVRENRPHKLGSEAAGTGNEPADLSGPTLDLCKIKPKTPELKPVTTRLPTPSPDHPHQPAKRAAPQSEAAPASPGLGWPVVLVVLLVGIVIGLVIGLIL